jgi:hypothetical protein
MNRKNNILLIHTMKVLFMFVETGFIRKCRWTKGTREPQTFMFFLMGFQIMFRGENR